MGKFRNALEFYLNHQFNLNKVLTFARFYVHQAKEAIEKEVDETEEKKYERVFGPLENLVDFNSLFDHLVDKVGSKTFIDPITKEDPLLLLANFFARPDVMSISKMGTEGTTFISVGNIAKYCINHLSN